MYSTRTDTVVCFAIWIYALTHLQALSTQTGETLSTAMPSLPYAQVSVALLMLLPHSADGTSCQTGGGHLGVELSGFPNAKPAASCGIGTGTVTVTGARNSASDADDDLHMYMGGIAGMRTSTQGTRGPVIPKPSTTCGGSDVVHDWCLQDAPMTHVQPPTGNFTDATCCAACVAEPSCVAWNTNAAQKSACHFRSGLGTPNQKLKCNFGVVRTPKPLPPTPKPLPPPKPAPPGAKNLLVIVCDDFRPMIAPFTDRYGVKADNLAKLGKESMVFNNTYVQQAVCGPSRNSFMTGKRQVTAHVAAHESTPRWPLACCCIVAAW